MVIRREYVNAYTRRRRLRAARRKEVENFYGGFIDYTAAVGFRRQSRGNIIKQRQREAFMTQLKRIICKVFDIPESSLPLEKTQFGFRYNNTWVNVDFSRKNVNSGKIGIGLDYIGKYGIATHRELLLPLELINPTKSSEPSLESRIKTLKNKLVLLEKNDERYDKSLGKITVLSE